MDRMLYVALGGTREIMRTQALVANNLANANTTGFRADLATMRAAYLNGPGIPGARVYTDAQGVGVDHRQGVLQDTGRELDVAISGDGYMAVQASDGTEAYTRAGELKLTTEGLLVTASGRPVLGNNGPIAIPPSEKIEIAADGTISAQPLGQAATTLLIIDRIKLVKPDLGQLRKNAEGLLQGNPGDELAADADITLVSGKLESSNVNPVEAMVSMIDLARQYEMQVKLLGTAKGNADKSAELLRAPG